MKTPIFGTLVSLILVAFMGGCSQNKTNQKAIIHTKYGDIIVRLYDETPQHRDNFVSLTEKGFYQDLLFHRVIQNFMIQGGDPDSRNALPGETLGEGGPGYTIPAEIKFPSLYHKRGVLAAARMSDQVNPKMESSGSQFYIVQGKIYTQEDLNQMEEEMNQRGFRKIMNGMIKEKQDSINILVKKQDQVALMELQQRILNQAREKQLQTAPFQFTEEQRKTYTTVGGTPFLDGSYTVFGEVLEGMAVVDTIAAVGKDHQDRPLEDVSMTIEMLP